MPVYDNDYWWSDNWDPLDFGRDFDFNRPFFDQFYELQCTVPHYALSVVKPTLENSDFCNQAGFLKDCYLLFDSRKSERCMYSKTCERCYDCIDCFKIFDCEACYQVVGGRNCQFSSYLIDCSNSHNCHYSSDLTGCSYCFGCTNLRSKSYYFYNQPLSPKDWGESVEAELRDKDRGQIWQEFLEFRSTQFMRAVHEINTENCLGDYLYNCKEAYWCFDSENLEACKYCYDLKASLAPNFRSYDVCHFGDAEYCYECVSIGNTVNHLKFCENVWASTKVSYSRLCNQCSNVFGSIALKNSKFCILNKQYTEAEYFALYERIRQHMIETREWGEFFPIQNSPFEYNETLAQEYFPISQLEAVQNAWGWFEEKESFSAAHQDYQIPFAIEDVGDEILEKVLRCQLSSKHYKITKSELEFYRRFNLAIPRVCFEERHKARLALRFPRKILERSCSITGEKLFTTVPARDFKTIYSKQAYLDAIG